MVSKRGYNALDDALLECSKEQLQQIMHIWGMDRDSREKPSSGFSELDVHMHDDIATRFVWEALSPDERQILYHALSYSARDGLSRDALQKKSQVPPEQYEPAIDNLLRYCLLFQQQEEIVQKGSRNRPTSSEIAPMIYPFREIVDILQHVGKEMFTPLGDRSEYSLAQVLAQFHDVKLYHSMRLYNVEWGIYYSRAEIHSIVIDKLMELDEPINHLKTISKKARQIYERIREQGGRVSLRDVRTYTKFSDHALYEAIHELESSLLAFDTLSKRERFLFIPRDLYEHLEPHAGTYEVQASANEEAASGPVEITPAVEFPAETITLYDIATVTNAVYQYPIEPTQARRVPKRLFNKIGPLLKGTSRYDYNGDEMYLEMLIVIMRQQDLIQLLEPALPDIKARYEPAPGLEAWSRMDATEQASAVLQLWLNNRMWSDLHGVNFEYWDPYSWHPDQARPTILKHLGKLKAGQWNTVASFLNAIWEEDAFALHPVQPYARKADRQKTPAIREKWNLCDGELYTGILAFTLYEMGIVALGYEDNKTLDELRFDTNPYAFKLTEFGAAVLSHMQTALDGKNKSEGQAVSSNNTHALVVQPNFELLLLQPDFPTLYSVLPFAQVNQISMVSRLTLTRTSLLRGLEGGKNIEQVIHTLEEHSQKELPQNDVYTLNDWAKNFKDARISKVLLFEVSSEAIASELAALPKLVQLGVRQVAPCLLVLNGLTSLQDVRRILEKEGITVHLDSSLGTSSKHQSSTYGMYR
jgi:hypothetical protein